MTQDNIQPPTESRLWDPRVAVVAGALALTVGLAFCAAALIGGPLVAIGIGVILAVFVVRRFGRELWTVRPRMAISTLSVDRRQSRAILMSLVLLFSLPVAFTSGVPFNNSGDTGIAAAQSAGDEEWISSTSSSVQMTVTDGSTTFFNDGDTIVAADADTGSERWRSSSPYDGHTNEEYNAVTTDELVIVGSDTNNEIAGLYKENGTEKFSTSLPDSPLAMDYSNGVVYVLSSTTAVHAIDISDGTEIWQSTTAQPDKGSVEVHNGSVFYAGYDGSGSVFYELDASDGSEVWSEPSPAISTGGVVADDTRAYFGTRNGIVAVDRSTGNQDWQKTEANHVDERFQMYDGTLYVVSQDAGTAHAISADGTIEWGMSGLSAGSGSMQKQRVPVDYSYVYAPDRNGGQTQVLHRQNGSVAYTISTNPGQLDLGPDRVFIGDRTANEIRAIWHGADSPSQPITGTVSDTDGNALSDANVMITDQSDESTVFSGTTDANGEWSTNLANGNYEVTASKPEYQTNTTTFSVSSSPVSVNQTLSQPGVSGRVTDQNGDPVPNATVTAWGTNPPNFNESQLTDLNETIDDLESQLNDPLPDEFNESLELTGSDGYLSNRETNVVAVHSESQWDLHGRTIPDSGIQYNIDPELSEPKITAPSGERVVLSIWNPTDTGGTFLNREDAIDESLPGRTTTGTVVVEQLSPTGGIQDTRTLETEPVLTANPSFSFDSKTHEAAVAELPSGVYRVYPEGHKESAYLVTVGEPDELVDTFTSDIEDQLVTLDGEQERLSELLGDDRIVRKTVKTDENGEFTVDMPSGVNTAQANAMRADGTILDGVTDPGLEDLREAQVNDYNGSFYLPSPRPNTVEPPASNVTVNVYRSPEVPLGDLQSFADLQEFLEQERLNETIEDLQSEYDKRFADMERNSLERVYSDHRTLVESIPGAEERYLEQSDYEEIQNASDLSNTELPTETNHMQVALAGIGEIDPPDLEDENPIDVENGTVNLEYPLPDSVDPETARPERIWSDGSDPEPIDEQYWSIESRGVANQDDVLVIEDLPIDDSDPAAFDVRIRAAGSGDGLLGNTNESTRGLLDDRLSALNPAFGGSVPDIDAVDVNKLAPGPNERVSMTVRPAEDTGFERLDSAEVIGPDGTTLNTTVSGTDTASFTTTGEGKHFVRMTIETISGDPFVYSFSVRALQQGRSDPPTVRAETGTGGQVFALAGNGLEDADIESDRGDLEVNAVVPGGEIPGSVHIKPQAAMDRSATDIDVQVLEGSDESTLSSNIETVIHLDSLPADTVVWRGEPSTWTGQPLERGGGSRYGSVMDRSTEESEKYVIRTFTDGDGAVQVTINEEPGWWAAQQHSLAATLPRLTMPSLPLVGSSPEMAAGGSTVAGVLGVGVVARRRRGAS